MKEGVRLTFKGISQEKRRKILKVLSTLGLNEISSQHDESNDRHSYEMHLEGDVDITEPIVVDLDDEPYFRVEAGVGC